MNCVIDIILWILFQAFNNIKSILGRLDTWVMEAGVGFEAEAMRVKPCSSRTGVGRSQNQAVVSL